MKTADYLAALRACTRTRTDYAVAKMLGIERASISVWKRGASLPDPLACFRIAEALRIDPARVVADIECERDERGKREHRVRLWRLWIEKSAARLAAILAVVLSAGGAPDTSRAAPVAPPLGSAAVDTSTVIDDVYIVAMVRCSRHPARLWITPLTVGHVERTPATPGVRDGH